MRNNEVYDYDTTHYPPAMIAMNSGSFKGDN